MSKARKRKRRGLVALLRGFLGDCYYGDPGRGLYGGFSAPNRMAALEDLLAEARGRTVLDLGCAEGLIAEEFLTAGASGVDGFDIRAKRIANARRLVSSPKARFEVGDLRDWQAFEHRHSLLPSYDIVLFLGIYQHLPLRTRAVTLSRAAARCRNRMAVRAPAELMDEMTEILDDSGFNLTREIAGNGRGVGRLRLYARRNNVDQFPLEASDSSGAELRSHRDIAARAGAVAALK